MTRSPWQRRIQRAEELANSCAPAAGILQFYAQIARFQATIFEELSGQPDPSVLVSRCLALLSLVNRSGTPALALAAQALARDGAKWEDLLANWHDAAEEHQFFARCLLEPYTAYLARRSDIALIPESRICPFCGEKPLLAVLRPEGDGAKRSLICSLCFTEWMFRRILCPNCGEEDKANLPVYVPAAIEHVRVEACDRCKTYFKSIDLTKNGLADPVVDEIATVAVNIWAEEHGYLKLTPNLMGM